MPCKSLMVCSFGYKHGMPEDADFVFDVRCLPNPYWEESMKDSNGFCDDVFNFVFSSNESQKYYDSVYDTVTKYLELTKKDFVNVYIGCTGGQHRSVAFTRKLSSDLRKAGYDCREEHRERERFQ